jgi:hypothetical protein
MTLRERSRVGRYALTGKLLAERLQDPSGWTRVPLMGRGCVARRDAAVGRPATDCRWCRHPLSRRLRHCG